MKSAAGKLLREKPHFCSNIVHEQVIISSKPSVVGWRRVPLQLAFTLEARAENGILKKIPSFHSDSVPSVKDRVAGARKTKFITSLALYYLDSGDRDRSRCWLSKSILIKALFKF